MARRTSNSYTSPELRERLKSEIMAGDRGGRPGQWSARKAQLLAREYERAGGGYRGERTQTQEHLVQWTEERWTTRDGEEAVRGSETARYLPESAWEKLTPEEREDTDRRKREASKRGEQFVANPPAAKQARREASQELAEPFDGYDDLRIPDLRGRLRALDEDRLEAVERYERAHKGRKGVLAAVDHLLELHS